MSDENSFGIVNFGADLLGAYYTSIQQSNSIRSLPSVQSNVSLSSNNSNLTPWEADQVIEAERLADDSSSAALYKLLKSDYSSIQNKDEFIGRLNSIVRDADLDDGSKGLFTLYNALKDLKTIAEYAGDPRTSDSKMEALAKQFKLGLAQVKEFISTESFEELTLLYGEKTNNLTALAGLGRAEFDFVGPVVHEGEVDDPISSLVGGEVFTITLTKSTSISGVVSEVAEDFEITVPADEASRTMETLVILINAKIQETKTTDDDGEEIPFYNTKFYAEEIDNDKYGFRIKTHFSEEITFAAADTEPALYVTGNVNTVDITTKQIDDSVPTTSFITKLTDLGDLTASEEYHRALFASDGAALLEPDTSTVNQIIDPLDGAATTQTNAIATDSVGNVYIVGSTDGRFGNHLNNSETGDAYLNKYDASGTLVWSRLVGSQGDASAYAVTIDADDNVIIAGSADKISTGVSNNPLATSTDVFDGKDSFVVKYNSVGTQQWIYLSDEYGTDGAASLTTDLDGNVYITGQQNSLDLSSTIISGNDNAYVLKLDGSNGNQTDYVEIGSSLDDLGQSIAVGSDGNIIVATHEDGNFILQKLDKDNLSSSLWSYDFGDLGSGSEISQVVVDGSRIYVTGSSNNSLTGGGSEIDPPLGGLDSFVLALDDAGGSATADWTKFIGSDKTDRSGSINVADGKVYLTGTTNGDVDGDGLTGGTDSFAMKIDATSGATDWTKQIGYTDENREVTGVAFATLGSSVLSKLGLPNGGFADAEKRLIETQTTARAGDYFYIKINDSITKKIEIKAGDTYRTLSNRINQASFRYLNSSVSFSSGSSTSKTIEEEVEFDAKAIIAANVKKIQNERNGIVEEETFVRADLTAYGNSLRIATKDGGKVELIAGRGDQDALVKLGLEATLVLSNEELFNLENEEEFDKKIGGVFAFKLDDRFSVLDKRDARFVAQELEAAIGIVQSAFRSLTYDPIAEQIKKDALRNTDGPVPPALRKQLANYQDGLNRINAILPQGGGFIV